MTVEELRVALGVGRMGVWQIVAALQHGRVHREGEPPPGMTVEELRVALGVGRMWTAGECCNTPETRSTSRPANRFEPSPGSCFRACRFPSTKSPWRSFAARLQVRAAEIQARAGLRAAVILPVGGIVAAIIAAS
jgi:hypothetical protein